MPADTSPPDERFPRDRRLLSKAQFDAVFRGGRKVVRPSLILFLLARDSAEQHSRIGLAVSRKVGNAVVRNLLRRRVKDIFRRNQPRFLPASDIVVIARPGADALSFDALAIEFLGAFAHHVEREERRRAERPPEPT